MKSFRFGCIAAALALASTAASAQQAAPQAAAGGAGAPFNNSLCTGCHTIPGYQSVFPRVYRVPMISGQSAKYIEAALQSYKKGERSHPSMTAVAKGLSDQQIVELAAYYSARGSESK